MAGGPGNLLADLPRSVAEEQTVELVTSDNLRIERIVSTGQASAPGFWYDQDWPEWVLVLAGSAGVLFEGDGEPRVLRTGDHLLIPAHRRHRVAWTDAEHATVWLAVHFRCID
ncbi:MAG TPA: cupin domain-containing protein [Xanthobacteraceae bacterium]|nr:cupin domain-containing protein [Xanthobacteraceae bacterium]